MHQSSLIIQSPTEAAAQLILLFHGVGSDARSLLPLGQRLAAAFPQAMVVSVTAPNPSDISPNGFQWFSVADITEENRVDRVAAALPSFEACVAYWQAQAGVGAAATALVGFSQGAIMALASSVRPDPGQHASSPSAGASPACRKAPCTKAPQFTCCTAKPMR